MGAGDGADLQAVDRVGLSGQCCRGGLDRVAPRVDVELHPVLAPTCCPGRYVHHHGQRGVRPGRHRTDFPGKGEVPGAVFVGHVEGVGDLAGVGHTEGVEHRRARVAGAAGRRRRELDAVDHWSRVGRGGQRGAGRLIRIASRGNGDLSHIRRTTRCASGDSDRNIQAGASAGRQRDGDRRQGDRPGIVHNAHVEDVGGVASVGHPERVIHHSAWIAGSDGRCRRELDAVTESNRILIRAQVGGTAAGPRLAVDVDVQVGGHALVDGGRTARQMVAVGVEKRVAGMFIAHGDQAASVGDVVVPQHPVQGGRAAGGDTDAHRVLDEDVVGHRHSAVNRRHRRIVRDVDALTRAGAVAGQRIVAHIDGAGRDMHAAPGQASLVVDDDVVFQRQVAA